MDHQDCFLGKTVRQKGVWLRPRTAKKGWIEICIRSPTNLMSPYSRRPPPPEPLSLGTGDFEAVSYGPGGRVHHHTGNTGNSHLGVPRAPRTPIFHRSAPVEPPSSQYGFGNANGYPSHYAPASQAPAAPHSLSPMAMNSSRNAASTGPQRVQETVVIRSRPSVKAGVSILLAGALIGGVIGITMRMRQNEADASFAAAAQHDAPPAAAPATPSPMANGGVIGSSSAPTPNAPMLYFPPTPVGSSSAVAANGNAKDASAKDGKDKKHAPTFGGHVAAGGHPNISTKVTTPKEPKEKDDGYHEPKNPNEPDKTASAPEPPTTTKKGSDKKVASKGGDDDYKEPGAPKGGDSKSDKGDKGGGKKTGGKSGDADALLRAAMGATENTL